MLLHRAVHVRGDQCDEIARQPVFGGYVDRQDGVVTITMSGPGFRTVVAYNRSITPQQVSIPATSSVAMLSDKHGNEQQVAAENGFYTFTLDPVTAFFDSPWGERVRFIGGSPIKLRQAL